MTNWFDFLPSQQAWIDKFANQAERMKRNFQRGNKRCGFFDGNKLPHGGPSDDRKRRETDEIDVERYDCERPSVGVKQLTTGLKPVVSPNGLKDNSQITLVRKTTTKLVKKWPNGTMLFRII